MIADQVTSLAWTSYGSNSEENKFGILIGGLSCGNIAFWSPEDNSQATLDGSLNNYRCLKIHSFEEQQAIHCLAVNSHKPNLIVSGGSTVLIHNIDSSCRDVQSFSPSQVPFETSTVTSVGWNNRVAHIFASASDNGTGTVWDLKNKKAIMNLVDQNFALDVYSSEALQ